MYYLEQIKLGNIRRFAADVSIPVSRGATIFLAPNGTGKTSLFEAIELCLTGQVERIKTSTPDALIRDGMPEAFSEMRFSGNIACHGSIRKGSTPQISGNHSSLFPDIDLENLPYLLRLTHLLPQRGTEWFVQSDTSEQAGSLLEKLPIGREAMRASTNIQKIKRGFTTLTNQTDQELKDIAKEFQDWENLLARKNSITLSMQGELSPKEIIRVELNGLIGRFENLTALEGTELPLLRARAAELLQLLEIELGKARQKADAITLLEKVPAEYIALADRLELTDEASKRQQAEVINAKAKYLDRQQTLETITAKLGAEKAALLLIRQRLQITSDLKNGQEDLAKNEESLKVARLLLETLQTNHLTEQKRQQAELQVRELHQRNAVAAGALLAEEQQIIADRSAIDRWKTLVTQMNFALSTRDNLNAQMTVLRAQSITFDQDLQSNQRSYSSAVSQHNALITAADTIKNAVATIVSHLPVDSTACPVCLAEYEPNVLRAKMEEALRQIQPGLDEANKSMIDAKQAFDNTTRAKEENRLAADNAQAAITQVDDTIENIQNEITFLRTRFAGAPDYEEAEKALKIKDEEYKIATQQNLQEKVAIPVMMSSTEWSILLESLNQTAKQITEADKNIKDLTSQDEQLKNRIDELKKTLTAFAQSDTSQTIEEKEQAIRDLELSVQITTTELTESRQILDKAEETVARLSRQLSEIGQQIDALKARWARANLAADPTADSWEKAQKGVMNAIANIESEIVGVQRLNTELAKWRVTEELRLVDQDIDRVRGGLTISEHTEMLSVSLRESETKLNTIKERSRAFHDLAENLRGKLDLLQEYLLAINEPWKELLHRVVLDPRFTDTTLSAYTKNNKQHAEVNVPLHNSNIGANFVASEAQITDLQFTFLLAMALNNQWTPWRGLLLDDPTQHHDLVHASSVFDLLRDYIVDHQFQVLLATHDSVHAKFFLRKLQNDGIPANLIQLHAAKDGVIAEPVRV